MNIKERSQDRTAAKRAVSSKQVIFAASMLLAVFLCPIELYAQQDGVNSYLFVQSAKGGCADSNHKGWIDVSNFQMNFRQAPEEGGHQNKGQEGREGSPQTIAECVITKQVDSASVQLIDSQVNHKPLGLVQLDVTKVVNGHKVTIANYRFMQAHIISIEVIRDANKGVFVEKIYLGFHGARIRYYPINKDGVKGSVIEMHWNANGENGGGGMHHDGGHDHGNNQSPPESEPDNGPGENHPEGNHTAKKHPEKKGNMKKNMPLHDLHIERVRPVMVSAQKTPPK